VGVAFLTIFHGDSLWKLIFPVWMTVDKKRALDSGDSRDAFSFFKDFFYDHF
jgi:hypothetical protein